MSSDQRSDKAAHIRHLLDTEGETVGKNARYFNDRRYEAIAEVGEDRFERLRTNAREIKEDAIDRLPELIETLRGSVEANGGELYVADDADDATEYIESVCAGVDADSLVKSKSMTTEEIGVNEALEAAGVDVHETDLGELVIQVAEEEPSHLIGPGFHKSREEIATLFNEHFEPEKRLETAQELTAFARDYLAERIREADVGMTGANFVIADSGTIALVTNEGNARKVIESTNHHIAVTGVEKILPTLSDLRPFVEIIARTGTGQSTAVYNTLVSGPVNSPPVPFEDPDAERTFHLVLIDNGRREMREDDQLRETLYCVRCGACANTCANFQSVGGHAFGGETYTGGIGTGWEYGVHGEDGAASMNDYCTGCSRCEPACPVKIDIPWINTVVRDRLNRSAENGDDDFDFLVEGLTPDAEPGDMDAQKRFFGNFPTLARLGSATAPLSNWLAGTDLSRSLLERYLGVDSRRELPTFRRETLRDWFDERDVRTPADPGREAVLYPDPYTNHVAVERGKAAVRALEALGVAVEVPDLPPSGRAPLSQGMVATAEDRASTLYGAVADHLRAGKDLVVVEPSALAMFRSDYEHLLPAERFEYLAGNSYELMEYVFGLLENGADPDALAGPRGAGEVVYHGHCQQRTLGLDEHTVAVLETLGYDVETTDAECCGMAGSFGYKSDYYELSVDVGETLESELRDAGGRRVLASGTSCTDQIDALLDREPTHPVELVAPL